MSPDRPPARVRVGGGEPGEPAGQGRYDVVIGRGLVAGRAVGDGVDDAVPTLLDGAGRVLVLHAAPVAQVADVVVESLRGNGFEVHTHRLPDGEAAKTAEVLTECWALLGRASFTRTDAIVAVGGGAVTDAAGFVAATWLRGVRVLQIPTTLLAMVDAAVGGKTGLNIAEGKNLVGAFHPPAGVIADIDVLATLPRADLVAGMAEVVKAGFIADPVILERVQGDRQAALDVAGPVLAELIERAVAVKAEVVTRDLRESSLREILNYGHTFAHAIEQVEGYTWRHGDAVAVGMIFAAELGRLAGRTPEPVAVRHAEVIGALGLPMTYPAAADDDRWQLLLTAMGRDKKTRGATLRFVVLDDLARPGRLVGPDPALLEGARARVLGR